jgi:hypothetical protein
MGLAWGWHGVSMGLAWAAWGRMGMNLQDLSYLDLYITPCAQKGPQKALRYAFVAKGNKALCPAQKQKKQLLWFNWPFLGAGRGICMLQCASTTGS